VRRGKKRNPIKRLSNALSGRAGGWRNSFHKIRSIASSMRRAYCIIRVSVPARVFVRACVCVCVQKGGNKKSTKHLSNACRATQLAGANSFRKIRSMAFPLSLSPLSLSRCAARTRKWRRNVFPKKYVSAMHAVRCHDSARWFFSSRISVIQHVLRK